MALFRKLPVIIEAIEWDGKNKEAIDSFCVNTNGISQNYWHDVYKNGNYVLKIRTLEGDHTASIGDYLIKGVKGEFYPCKPDIFKQTYESI